LIVFTFALLIGLSPISNHVSSMQLMPIDDMATSHEGAMDRGDEGRAASGSCCDEMAQFDAGCAFLAPQLDCIGLNWGNERVAYSSLVVRLFDPKSIVPPPKA